MDEEDIKITVSDDGGKTFKSTGPEKDKRFKVDKKSLMRFGGIFLGIIILVAGITYAWENYLSPDARSARDMANQYEKYLDWESKYRETLKNDTFGGETPEATLKLFVDALKKGDVDLASKYFWIDERTPQSVWKDGMQKLKDEGKLEEVIKNVERAQKSDRNTGSEKIIEFTIVGQNNEIDYSITLKINEENKIWKIENM